MPAQATPVPTPIPQAQPTVIYTPTVTDMAKPITEAKPAKPSASTVSAPTTKSSAASSRVQPTPAVQKTDVAGDILKAAPAGVDVAKKLFGL
ncbi:MAG TPA: hypothetical protein VK791_07345 [bacterium]|nr:hypothetical protein [bacterium]